MQNQDSFTVSPLYTKPVIHMEEKSPICSAVDNFIIMPSHPPTANNIPLLSLKIPVKRQ
jgi:hypothetical protein